MLSSAAGSVEALASLGNYVDSMDSGNVSVLLALLEQWSLWLLSETEWMLWMHKFLKGKWSVDLDLRGF